MSEWWSAVAVFWALYLVDGLSGGRRERLFLGGGCAWPRRARAAWRRRKRPAGDPPGAAPCDAAAAGSKSGATARCVGGSATLTQASWHFAAPWPWAWMLPLEDASLSLAPEGFVNWPSVSTARPPPLPERLLGARWGELRPEDVTARGGWIFVRGARLAPVTAALDGAELRRRVERWRELPPEARAAEIAAWQRRRFSVTRARRRLAVALGRTRGLAWQNTAQTAGWLVLSWALLTERFVPAWPAAGEDFAPWRHWQSPQAPWWALLGWLLVMHFLAVAEAWRLHRRLHPTRREERGNLVSSALLLPAQALRLRAALLRPLALEGAPLAWILVAGSRPTARAAAAATWRDLLHPWRPADLPAAAARWAAEAGEAARPALQAALAEARAAGRAELDEAELTAPPARPGPAACAYCPRCGDEFTRADGVCAQGVALRPLPATRR